MHRSFTADDERNVSILMYAKASVHTMREKCAYFHIHSLTHTHTPHFLFDRNFEDGSQRLTRGCWISEKRRTS